MNLDKDQVRSRLKAYGRITKLAKGPVDKVSMACIDGSVNKVGGSFPHYIELYQALAKLSSGQDQALSNIYSPLLDGGSEEEDQRKKLLAKIELDLALNLAQSRDDLDLILMDGGLIRYSIDAGPSFDKLRSICSRKDIILAGFVKEVKTDFVYGLIYGPNEDPKIYDKDLLYGVLDIGDMVVFDGVDLAESEEASKYTNEDIDFCFLRLSNFPGITGIDIIRGQRDKLDYVAGLSYAITPPMSRGVPLLIDMVDTEVRLSDDLTRDLIRSNVDRDLYERFFVSERDMRKY